MQNHSSQNANRIVRLSNGQNGGIAHASLSDDRSVSRRHQARVARPDLPDLHPRPATTITESNRPIIKFCWATLAFFLEGFAIYGASVHPSAAFPIHALLTVAKAREPRLVGSEPVPTASENDASRTFGNSNVVEHECLPRLDARPSRRWNWLASLGEPIVTLWEQWRREREIKKAVAALAQYDDRTLRDIGICGRSEIEQVVRRRRDC